MVYLFFYVSQFPEFQALKLGEIPPSFKVVALNRAWVAIGDAGGRSNHSANTWWCQPGCLSWYAKASWTSWPTPKTKGSSKVSMVQRMSFHGFVSGEIYGWKHGFWHVFDSVNIPFKHIRGKLCLLLNLANCWSGIPPYSTIKKVDRNLLKTR